MSDGQMYARSAIYLSVGCITNSEVELLPRVVRLFAIFVEMVVRVFGDKT